MTNPATPSPRCPRCDAPLPESAAPHGLCPRCLMQQAASAPSDIVYSGSGSAQIHRTPPPTPQELAPHFPQYEILELIGHGGMGAVYRAKQRSLERIVALKVLTVDTQGDPSFGERFAREARTLASLSHPGLVGVHDFGQSGPWYFIAMEFVDGASLRQMIRAQSVAPREALSIVAQVCDTLQYAHDQGVVHRDIKPENILVTRRGHAKVLDFGLAKLVGARTSGDALTLSRQVMGTPHYMAPEQWEKPLTVDHRADIFALGVVFYELLTGELPMGRFPLPSSKVTVDVRLDEVVLKTLEKEPARRYQQASEIKKDMDSISQSPQGLQTSQAPPPPPIVVGASLGSAGTGAQGPRKTRVWPYVAVGAGCLLLLALPAALLLYGGARVARQQQDARLAAEFAHQAEQRMLEAQASVTPPAMVSVAPDVPQPPQPEQSPAKEGPSKLGSIGYAGEDADLARRIGELESQMKAYSPEHPRYHALYDELAALVQRRGELANPALSSAARGEDLPAELRIDASLAHELKLYVNDVALANELLRKTWNAYLALETSHSTASWSSDGKLNVRIDEFATAKKELRDGYIEQLHRVLDDAGVRTLVSRMRVDLALAFGEQDIIVQFDEMPDGSIQCTEITSISRTIAKEGAPLPPAHQRLWDKYGSHARGTPSAPGPMKPLGFVADPVPPEAQISPELAAEFGLASDTVAQANQAFARVWHRYVELEGERAQPRWSSDGVLTVSLPRFRDDSFKEESDRLDALFSKEQRKTIQARMRLQALMPFGHDSVSIEFQPLPDGSIQCSETIDATTRTVAKEGEPLPPALQRLWDRFGRPAPPSSTASDTSGSARALDDSIPAEMQLSAELARELGISDAQAKLTNSMLRRLWELYSSAESAHAQPSWSSDGSLRVELGRFPDWSASLQPAIDRVKAELGDAGFKLLLARLRSQMVTPFGSFPVTIEYHPLPDGSIQCTETIGSETRTVAKEGAPLPPAHQRLWDKFARAAKSASTPGDASEASSTAADPVPAEMQIGDELARELQLSADKVARANELLAKSWATYLKLELEHAKPEWTSDGRLSVSISPIGADTESIEQDSRALEALLGADTTKRVLARLRVGTSMAFGRGPNADVIEFATASDGSITCLERTSWGARQITKAGGSLPPAHARLWALFGSKNKR